MLSRVADSLYWMSRYLERAEHTARLIDVHLNLMLDDTRRDVSLQRWNRILRSLHQQPVPMGDTTDAEQMMRDLSFDTENPASIESLVGLARENARQVREQISSEMWMQLNQLHLHVKESNVDEVWEKQPHEFFRDVRNGAHLFQGITGSTMVRTEGWHFIQLGRYIERALLITTLLDIHYRAFALSDDLYNGRSVDDYFPWLGLLRFFTAFEAYTKVYNADLRANRITEFLLLNAEFPHSVRFCVEMMYNAANDIADVTTLHRNSRLHRTIGRLRSALSFDEVEDILPDLHRYLDRIRQQCLEIHDAIYQTYIYRPVDSTI